ncbi:leucine-rich receptor-like protein kinase family protein [Actinidia rufa]|uniref:Leucine-rich receptor-like protein kinase family protein n=1 Tax=Actinidia rufa TaxID=165716 RepID=A0A7J0EN07_9ERIC|nr:leucine-rich receptor-like protein kinase family protein [Actinidia rufa]
MATNTVLLFLVVIFAPVLSCAAQVLAEMEALNSFKRSLHDPLGALNGWDSSTPLAPCDWRGIACYGGRVSELRLPRLRLAGPLTSQLANLRMLRKLSLRSNFFNGTIPSSLFQGTLLHSVFLQSNSFSGKIPPEIAHLTGLKILNLAQNHLSGEVPGDLPQILRRIPASLGDLQQLQYLWLDDNLLGGTLPSAIANCSSLVHFSAEGNALRGVIPAAMGALPGLQVISLSHNNLSDLVPSSMFCNVSGYSPAVRIVQLGFNAFTDIVAPETATCYSALQVLDLQQNHIQGVFPLWLMNISTLTRLDISGNLFSGSIPNLIGNLYRLEELKLANNSINGVVPFEITNCSLLRILDLEGNQFTGEIPSFLSGLRALNLRDNSLTGDLPEGLMALSNLTTLNLSGNKFSGEVLEIIGNLRQLSVLNLSGNGFSGTIPTSLGLLYKLRTLDLSRQNLSGELPFDLAGLPNLQVIALQENKLSGDVPEGFSSLMSLHYLNLSSNAFSGPIPSTFGFLKSLAVLSFLLRWRKRLKEGAAGEKKPSPTRASSAAASGGRGSGENGGPKLVMFNNKITLAETLEATRQFDEENVQSRTRYGLVFKASYNDGMVLSIRRLPDGSLDENMFRKEAESLGKVKHRNLTVLRGYYAGPPDMRLLVYDYMPNGNLATLLQEAAHQDGHVLNWPMRHLIALGIARGLAFLHSAPMVHGDIKPQNVLFDADFEAHLSDIGLDKLMVAAPAAEPSTSVGTLGYVSPEATLTGVATKESDVYSFGIVLLELLTGKRPVMFTEDEDIVKWVKKQLQRGQISELLEPGLLELDPESSEWEEFLLGVKVGLLCTAPDPLDRPIMSDIVFMLEGCRVGPDIPSSADPTSQPSPA